MITLEDGPCSTFLIRELESGNTRLIQIDTDFPRLAQTFGWSGYCDKLSLQVICDAYAFLDEHVEAKADDPGYF
jgi:hypothetical protein